MSRLRCLSALFIAFFIMTSMHAEVDAGPFSLSFARSFRSGRETRAPFKSPEIMVARGFGKRNLMPPIIDGGDGRTPATTETANDKFKPAMLQAGNGAPAPANVYVGGTSGGGGDAYENERIPIDWVFAELAANPNFARLLLHRLMDCNGNGKVTTRDLASAPFESIEYI